MYIKPCKQNNFSKKKKTSFLKYRHDFFPNLHAYNRIEALNLQSKLTGISNFAAANNELEWNEVLLVLLSENFQIKSKIDNNLYDIERPDVCVNIAH